MSSSHASSRQSGGGDHVSVTSADAASAATSTATNSQRRKHLHPLHISYSATAGATSANSSTTSKKKKQLLNSNHSCPDSKAEPLLSEPSNKQKQNQQKHGDNNDIPPSTSSPNDDGANTSPPCCSSGNCCYDWLTECVWPGMGLFGESYLLFSIGTLKPLWEVLFPDCFYDGQCSDRLLSSLSYSVVLGVITGMLLIGYMARSLGRRRGSITTAGLMCGAACGLAFCSMILARVRHRRNDDEEGNYSSMSNPVTLFRCMSILLFVFGVGVGGEYPLAASSASEKAMGDMKKSFQLELEREEQPDGLIVIDEDASAEAAEAANSTTSDHNSGNVDGGRNPLSEGSSPGKAQLQQEQKQSEPQRHRGRKIQLVFTMQGMGIFFNSLTMTALLIITGQNGNNGDEYNATSLLAIWRITYGLGALILIYVLVSRIKYLTESAVWLDDKRRREQLARNSIAPASPTSMMVQDDQQQQQFQHFDHHPYSFPVVSQTPTGISMVSSVSSLSAPSVAINPEDMTIKEVPSTDPEDDIKTSTTSLLLRNYGIRLLGCSLAWLLWDVAFYGNKLFQSTFLLTLTGEDTTLLEFALAATLNSAVALMGYYGAAAIIDHPMVGRCRLQQWGFLATGLLFVGCGFLYNNLSPTVLVSMYLGSSFFGQLGPNATTFLLPAEIFPTEMRTMCHGIAAASGKIGALLAAVMFNHVKDLDMFLLSGYASFAACAITFWTIPETAGLDLYEVDRKWRMILDGRKAEYEGEANSPKYLSYYERNKLILTHQQSSSTSHNNHGLDNLYI